MNAIVMEKEMFGDKKKVIVFLFAVGLFFAGSIGLSAQQIVTASEFLDQVGQRYEQIQDYSARIDISANEKNMSGMLYYRYPDLLRIDFSDPEEQVLVTDGSTLILYIPALKVTMEQPLDSRRQGDITGLASREGLGLLQRMYAVSYLESPTPVSLDENNSERVVKLRLTWRSPSEGFRELVIAINDDRMIRRMTGTTVNYEEVVMDFNDIQINQNIPVEQFDYRAPPSANRFLNFLFAAEE